MTKEELEQIKLAISKIPGNGWVCFWLIIIILYLSEISSKLSKLIG